MTRFAALLLFVTLAPTPAQAEEPFQEYARKNGIVFERRPVDGSRYQQYRASTLLSYAPQVVFDGIWAAVTGAVPATIKKRVVVSQTDREIVVYDQIKTPVVSDRDVTIRIVRT